MGEVQMTICLEECGKKWRMGRQTKLGWQKEKEKREDFRRPTVEEEIEIVRVIQKKREEEEDLIKIRTVEEIVPR